MVCSSGLRIFSTVIEWVLPRQTESAWPFKGQAEKSWHIEFNDDKVLRGHLGSEHKIKLLEIESFLDLSALSTIYYMFQF